MQMNKRQILAKSRQIENKTVSKRRD